MADPRLIEAAQWAERLSQEASVATRARFDRWRAEPGNDDAWHAIDAARVSSATLAGHPNLLALRHATVARAALARPARRAAPWMLAAAACAAVVAPLALWRIADGGRPAAGQAGPASGPVYRTGVGQRLAVTLSDGSRLTLDTASQVSVAYTGTERHLVLDRGQALFEVAKHQARPFIVTAGGHAVTAHGTAFDVRLDPAAVVQVALVEGKVTVAPKAGFGTSDTRTVAMVPDDVLTASGQGMSIRHVPGRALALASWSEGRLVFEDETLGRAVAEMNRYGTPPMTVADPKAARVRISGSFRTGEVEPFLEALQLGFPVQVKRRPDGGILLASRG